MNNLFIKNVIEQLKAIDETQNENLKLAATYVAEALKNDGIIQVFGSGHSYAIALEMVERAGGLFATKMIKEPSMGAYEALPGVGDIVMRKVDIRPEDVLIITSHSGINPLPIEIALHAKEAGAKVIAVTAIEASKVNVSRHKSGLKLYEIADVNLDTLTPEGDAAIQVGDMKEKICPTSSVASVTLVQSLVYKVVTMLYDQGIVVDIRISSNVEGGLENNLAKHHKYAHRIYRI